KANEEPHESTPVLLPFASGDAKQARVVVCNDGAATPSVKISRVELFDTGPTSFQWTRFLRVALRGAQRAIFKTWVMRLLIFGGLAFAVAAVRWPGRFGVEMRWESLTAILCIPAYYVFVQGLLHTEYRYILAIHYMLFILAALAVYVVARLLLQGVRLVPR